MDSLSFMQAATIAPLISAELSTHLPPLHDSIKALLPLTPEERKTCGVFALSNYLREEDDEARGSRFAVAIPVAREHWYTLNPGQILIYTELYRFPEDGQYPAGTATLSTHVGPLRTFDAKRGLFYACSWGGGGMEYDLAADDVQDVWEVLRFIEVV